MFRLLFCLIACILPAAQLTAATQSIYEIYLGSREGDPDSIIENV